jgi:hypothetical protein
MTPINILLLSATCRILIQGWALDMVVRSVHKAETPRRVTSAQPRISFERQRIYSDYIRIDQKIA